ncbi:MAG: tRNA (adenosine(37)-N6)-dimethylallyltransferase MiaA [Dissulfurispiraceae bacterium]
MKKVILLLGPTCVGKTAVSLVLAKALNSEIISADSMQIYKHMDIGTAKPSAEEQRLIKHHMIDIVEPWDFYSTGEYIKDVQSVVSALHSRKKIPLVVGGTGLYIKSMTRGIFKGPSADWEMRNAFLDEERAKEGSLYRRLMSLDPAAASKIMPADTRRTIRALEVFMKSDTSLSEMHRTATNPLPYEFIKIGITRERKELYSMIDARIDAMMEQGLLEEVKDVMRIIKEHGTKANLASYPSMQAIGYKELTMYFDGDICLDEAINLIKQSSRNYAKRQFTWFKKEEGIQWIDVTGTHDANEIFQKVKVSSLI